MNVEKARKIAKMQKQIDSIGNILCFTSGSLIKLKKRGKKLFFKGNGFWNDEQEIDYYLWEKIRNFLEDERVRLWKEIEES